MAKTKLQGYKELFKTELLNYCVPFWFTNAQDKKNGGIMNCVDRKGEAYSTDKSVRMQGRCAWTYSYIYNRIERRKEYLVFANSCLAFVKEKSTDKTNGGMYFTVTADGKPTELPCKGYTYKGPFHVMCMLAKCVAIMEEKGI